MALSTGDLWRLAGEGARDWRSRRARYLALLRRAGFIYEREDGATVHTVDNPRPPR